MSDLISRQAAVKEIARWIGYIDEDMILRIQTGLKKVPSAEVTLCHLDSPCEYQNADIAMPFARPERKKGRWINYKDEHCCSVCDWVIIEDCWDEENRYDYCPYCGADMRGDGDE